MSLQRRRRIILSQTCLWVIVLLIMFNNVFNKQVLANFSMDQIKDRKVSLIKRIHIHHTHVLKCALVKEILSYESSVFSILYENCLFPFPQLPATYRSRACVLSHSWCPTLCDRIDCTPLGSSVCGIFQARILE